MVTIYNHIILLIIIILRYKLDYLVNGGDLVSTWVAIPEVHVELLVTR